MQSHDIETTGMVRKFGMAHEEVLRRADQALLFTCIDTFERAAKTLSAAIAHFNEHQRVVRQHDEIYFAAATAVIARHALHALRDESCFCVTFPALATARVRLVRRGLS